MDSRGLLRISDKVYVPENPPTLAARLIRHVHEQPSTGHPGRNRMVRPLSARFHLKNLAQRVAKYLKDCPVCCKLARHTGPAPLLRPLPVPDAPWLDISVDFVHQEKNHPSSQAYRCSDCLTLLVRNLLDIVAGFHCSLPPGPPTHYRDEQHYR